MLGHTGSHMRPQFTCLPMWITWFNLLTVFSLKLPELRGIIKRLIHENGMLILHVRLSQSISCTGVPFVDWNRMYAHDSVKDIGWYSENFFYLLCFLIKVCFNCHNKSKLGQVIGWFVQKMAVWAYIHLHEHKW